MADYNNNQLDIYQLDNENSSSTKSQNQKLNSTMRWRSLAVVAFVFDLLMVFIYLTYIPSAQTNVQTGMALFFPVTSMLISIALVLLVGDNTDNKYSKLLFVCCRFERLGASFTIFRQMTFSIVNGSSDDDVAHTGFFSSVYLAFTLGNMVIFMIALFQRVRIVK